ncbi:MAG: phage holin family protein [Bacteroidaceae bacterium]|nr:phage holin family protein [Bacteroidaceae bacterium]
MSVKENVRNITEDTQEYLHSYILSLKLELLERVSLLASDILSHLLFFIILLFAVLFASLALMFALACYVGYVASAIIIFSLLLFSAIVVCYFRKQLFVDVAVARLSQIFFSDNNDSETE